MIKYILALLISFTLITLSCKKLLPEVNGTVKNFTGLDGCGVMIVLDSGEKLEITSLPTNTSLITDRRVAIRYKTVSRVSICMAGTTAEIISLRYL